uniref:RRM domain-containing protein n=1 Tax=Gasterosteus aculeatus aculeatus TaxID=481459 RepID=A0AAQ4PFU6_GASAC
MNYTTKVVQVTNVSPSTTSEQMRTLFGFLGTIEELKLFPPDDSQMPVTSRVCFVKFQEPESVGVSQHLTNTVFVDRALIVVPFAEGSIPDEAKALSLLAPANAVAGILPGGGLLPTPNPMSNPGMGGNPFGVPNMDAMAAFGFPGAADQLLKFMTDPKLNPLAAGLNLSASLKADASNKEIEEAMKRVREAQSLISAAIEPGNKESKKKRSRSRSRSRRRRSRSRSRHRRTRSRSRRRSISRNKRRSKSPRRRHTDTRDQSKRSPSRSRDRKKDDSGRRRSKTPPKSYSTARRSHSVDRRRRKSRSHTRTPPKKRSPSPRRHKKDKKRDKERDKDRKGDKDRSRDERERSVSKKKKSKDKDRERERERERERKSDGEKGDVKVSTVTRDYDEEEQGYDSGKEREDRKDSDDSALSPQSVEGNGTSRPVKQAKVNGADDHHEEDMDVSD